MFSHDVISCSAVLLHAQDYSLRKVKGHSCRTAARLHIFRRLFAALPALSRPAYIEYAYMRLLAFACLSGELLEVAYCNTSHCTLRIARFALHASHCTLRNARFAMHAREGVTGHAHLVRTGRLIAGIAQPPRFFFVAACSTQSYSVRIALEV